MNFSEINDFRILESTINKINELCIIYKINTQSLYNCYFTGFANMLQESTIKNAFGFAFDVLTNYKKAKIAISIGDVVMKQINSVNCYIGNCITASYKLLKICDCGTVLIDNTAINFVDYNKFFVEKLFSDFNNWKLIKYNNMVDDIIDDIVVLPLKFGWKYNIIILDDSLVINKIMYKKLLNFNTNITTVTSVYMLNEKLSCYDYDAVIIDIYLSDKNPDGYEVAKNLRNLDANIFICGMSGTDIILNDEHADLFDIFIDKPWTNAKYDLFVNALFMKKSDCNHI
jgi:CheY-like chemotaxis protein